MKNVSIKRLFIMVLNLSLVLIIWSCVQSEKPPVARIENVIQTHHGTDVADPYRWLEDWNDPEVREWSDAQNQYARACLNRLPDIDPIRNRVSEIRSATSNRYYSMTWKEGRLYAKKVQPPLNQPRLVFMPSVSASARETVIVDPNRIDSSGAVSIDWYVPSPDGEIVAVSLSTGGSEEGDLHLYETRTGKQVDIVIPRVNGGTAGGDLAWLKDGSGFYYTRYPYPGERDPEDMNFYQQVWFHKMGTPISEDRYIFGKDFPRIAEIRMEVDPITGLVLITMQYGDSGKFKHYIGNRSNGWKQITSYEDKIVEAQIGPGSRLFMISRKDAPNGKLLVTDLKKPSIKKAPCLIAETGNSIITDFYHKPKWVVTPAHIYLTYQTGGPSVIKAFDRKGNPVNDPGIAPVSSVNELTLYEQNTLLFLISSYVKPPSWYLYNPVENKTIRTPLYTVSPVDFSDTEVIRTFTQSKDGTEIPINIMYRKGMKRDGNNPVLLYGYGGFGINRTPRFRPLNRIWIEQGGIYAVANIRGGGEFGEHWHDEGRLTRKQNVFDDFAAAMKYMVDAGYTSVEKLAINGGSNGGLLMGAMITQHPDLFRATVSTVGLYDMIRSELTPNGLFNVPEYGTVKDPAHFAALYAYSPYHNVKAGVDYPSILFMTGENDPRVDPMHSRKMIARLQAATTSDNPILLRTSSTTGHGGSTPLPEQIEEATHKFVFLFHELGIRYEEWGSKK